MDIIPGTSKPVISPLAHLAQDAWHYPTPDQSGLEINPNWGSIRKSVPGLGSIGLFTTYLVQIGLVNPRPF